MAAVAAIFWLSAALLIYGHLGYPLVLWLWARRRPRSLLTAPHAPAAAAPEPPRLTVIVVAHNEAAQIAGRVANLLEQDYPRDRLDLVIASDGSTDGTAQRARACAAALLENMAGPRIGIQVIELPVQQGKPAALNALIPAARGAIVVLADARQRFEKDALRTLAAALADPDIGAVSGELLLDAGEAQGPGPGLYWAYEKFLRKQESRIDSTLGATGAIYAIRRELFEPIPVDTVLDDMLIPLRLTRRGYRVLFEGRAKAHDRPAAPAAELQRKARTLGGNFQLFSRETWLFNPAVNRLWVQTLSHKVLRLACPLLLLGALGSSAILVKRPIYLFALVVQLAFYAAALCGAVLAKRGRRAGLISTAYLFCLLHWATVLGLVRFLRGGATAAWRAERNSPAPATGHGASPKHT